MSDQRGWWRAEEVALEEELTAEEVRVLGCLMEKQAATPEYYPLTLNALVTACNQSSNRDPVVAYDGDVVTEALDGLRAKKVVRIVHSPSGRAPKFKHVVDEALGLGDPERAVLTVMMLRGPQTLGELRTRTERLHPFESTAEVEAVLERLRAGEHPLVVRLERQPGQKEARYAHLLAGEPVAAAADMAAAGWPGSGRAIGGEGTGTGAAPRTATAERIDALEQRVAELESALDDLRRQLGA